jgi:hypothetical protein
MGRRQKMMGYLYRVALGSWVGALACFGFLVAPVLFQELTPAQAGTVVRGVLPSLQWYGLAISLLLAGAAWPRDDGKRTKGKLRLVLLCLTAVLAAANLFVIMPRMASLREKSTAPISELPKEHPIRAEYGSQHGASTAAMVAQLLLGLWALALPPGEERSGNSHSIQHR